jgi:hypothetical protein
MGGSVLFACEKKGSLGLGLYTAFLLKPICINTLRFKNNRLCHHWQVAAEPSKYILAALGSFGYIV